jgi:hypothetical protein
MACLQPFTLRDWLGSLTQQERDLHLKAALDLLASDIVHIDVGKLHLRYLHFMMVYP